MRKVAGWNYTTRNSDDAKRSLSVFFPQGKGKVIPDYDHYFHFQKDTMICVKKITGNSFEVDAYSSQTNELSENFSAALRQLANGSSYSIDTIHYEPQFSSRSNWRLLSEALFPGGAIIGIVSWGASALSKYLFMGVLELDYSSLVAAVAVVAIYVPLYIYLRRGAEP
jgi:hypothetical protein